MSRSHVHTSLQFLAMPKSSKKNLRDSLRAHQMRVEQAKYAKIAKGKALSSTEHSAKKKKRLVPLPTPSKADGTSSSTPSSVSKGKGKAAIPFYEGQRILLMGEGARQISNTSAWLLMISMLLDRQGTSHLHYPSWRQSQYTYPRPFWWQRPMIQRKRVSRNIRRRRTS